LFIHPAAAAAVAASAAEDNAAFAVSGAAAAGAEGVSSLPKAGDNLFRNRKANKNSQNS
jgi:hypothetical protein